MPSITGQTTSRFINLLISKRLLQYLLISEPMSFLKSSKASCLGGGVLGRAMAAFGTPLELLGVPVSSRSSFFSTVGVIELLLSGAAPLPPVPGLVALGAGL